MTRPKPLSPRMAELMYRISNGWQLSWTIGGRNEPVIMVQKGGHGRGGETKMVNSKTFWALVARGLITRDREGFPTTTYNLTPMGKACADERNERGSWE